MRVYVGIDMAKDKFYYCTMDDDQNILYSGNNCGNDRNAFDSFGKSLEGLRQMTKYVTIGMEST